MHLKAQAKVKGIDKLIDIAYIDYEHKYLTYFDGQDRESEPNKKYAIVRFKDIEYLVNWIGGSGGQSLSKSM